MNLRIGELTEMTGCQVVTIRYYEKRGLLGQPARSDGNFRLYKDKDIRRLKLIRLCRENDMSLSDIKILLNLMDGEMLQPDSSLEFFDQCLHNIETRLDSLSRLQIFLEHLKLSLTTGAHQKSEECCLHQAAAELCEHCQTGSAQEDAQ